MDFTEVLQEIKKRNITLIHPNIVNIIIKFVNMYDSANDIQLNINQFSSENNIPMPIITTVFYILSLMGYNCPIPLKDWYFHLYTNGRYMKIKNYLNQRNSNNGNYIK